MNAVVIVVVVVAVLALIGLALSARIVKQYEQGVLFRLGRVVGIRKPGPSSESGRSAGRRRVAPDERRLHGGRLHRPRRRSGSAGVVNGRL